MRNEIYEKFYDYLCETVKLYQTNGALRGFSDLAKKRGVTEITQADYFINQLHLIPQGQLPSRSKSDIIRDAISVRKKTHKRKNKFKQGDIVAWTWKDSKYRSVAVLQSSTYFYACLNYRGKENEQDRLWIIDDVPSDVELTMATEKEKKDLIIAICKKLYNIDWDGKQKE